MTAAFVLTLLGGCAALDADQIKTSSVISDGIPHWAGGEPPNTPPRPTETPEFPYVGVTPPTRADQPLSDEEQKKLAADLVALRNHVSARAKAKDDPELADTREASPLARGKFAGRSKPPDAAD